MLYWNDSKNIFLVFKASSNEWRRIKNSYDQEKSIPLLNDVTLAIFSKKDGLLQRKRQARNSKQNMLSYPKAAFFLLVISYNLNKKLLLCYESSTLLNNMQQLVQANNRPEKLPTRILCPKIIKILLICLVISRSTKEFSKK